MSDSVSTTEFVTNFPLRKLFCCHLKFATFQPTENSWTLLVDGTLQMRCDEKNVDKKTVIFSDSTGNVDVIIPSSMKQNVSDVLAENYCSLICELVDKSDDGIVTVKAKKLTPLQFKRKSNLEIAWATEDGTALKSYIVACKMTLVEHEFSAQRRRNLKQLQANGKCSLLCHSSVLGRLMYGVFVFHRPLFVFIIIIIIIAVGMTAVGHGATLLGGVCSSSVKCVKITTTMLLSKFQVVAKLFFRHLGFLIAKYPLPFVIGPVLITVAGVAGIYLNVDLGEIDYDTSMSDFFPENSKSWSNMHKLQSIFPTNDDDEPSAAEASSFFGISFIFLRRNLAYATLTSSRSNGSVVSEHGLRCVSDLIRRLKEIEVEHRGVVYKWQDLCYKRTGGGCVEHPLVQTLTLLGNAGKIRPLLEPLLGYPTVTLDNVQMDNTPVLGRVTNGDGDGRRGVAVVKASAFRVPMLLREPVDDFQDELNNLWREKFLQTVRKIRYPGYNVHCLTWHSVIEEIQRNGQMLSSYFPYLITILAVLTIGGCCDGDSITSKPWLGVFGLISATFAILTAVGILFHCRYSYISMVMMMPFLVLCNKAVSVDNVFLMLSAWRETRQYATIDERIAETVADSAVSILITALTDGLSFGIGNLTPFPAVQIFCTYCAVALLCTFLYQVTFFTALLVYDGRRELSNRHCVTFRRKMTKNFEFSKNATNNQDQPINRWPILQKFNETLSSTMAWVLCNSASKYFVSTIYLLYLGVVGYGMYGLQVGTAVDDLLPGKSYVAATLQANDRYFSAYGDFAVAFLDQPFSLSDSDLVERHLNLYRSLTSTVHSSEGQFWLQQFLNYKKNKQGNVSSQSRVDNDDQRLQLSMLLDEFFQLSENRHLASDVQFNDKVALLVERTKMTVRLRNAGRSNYSRIASMLRRRFDESALSGFVFHPTFLLIDQDESVWRTLFQDVAVAVLIMTTTVALFVSSLSGVAAVGLAVCSISAGVVALLSLWQVRVDIISMITITMSVGLSVDYVAHVAYHYVVSISTQSPTDRSPLSLFTAIDQPTSVDKLTVAFRHVAVPTLQSGFLATAGVSVLILVDSRMVETFVKTVLLAVTVGMFHGLVFLPTLLPLLCPAAGDQKRGREAWYPPALEEPKLPTRVPVPALTVANNNLLLVLKEPISSTSDVDSNYSSASGRSQQPSLLVPPAAERRHSAHSWKSSQTLLHVPHRTHSEHNSSAGSTLVPVTDPAQLLNNFYTSAMTVDKSTSRQADNPKPTSTASAAAAVDDQRRQELARMVLQGDTKFHRLLQKELINRRPPHCEFN
ncbi:Patched-related protein 9 [Trichinella papuae]|uniref:Patched-related protein 9 n=1 Tax=Trichinella papuae TaxID=268474 RepID=A0A0V1N7L7_9BILA|nr:Patched-related protein 9 [Trichinella papuae]